MDRLGNGGGGGVMNRQWEWQWVGSVVDRYKPMSVTCGRHRPCGWVWMCSDNKVGALVSTVTLPPLS